MTEPYLAEGERDEARAEVERCHANVEDDLRLVADLSRRVDTLRFMARGWRRLAAAAANALGDLELLEDPLDQIREILGDDTGRMRDIFAAPGYHVGTEERESTEVELIEDVRRVKERADRLLDETADLQGQRDEALAERDAMHERVERLRRARAADLAEWATVRAVVEAAEAWDEDPGSRDLCVALSDAVGARSAFSRVDYLNALEPGDLEDDRA